MEIVLFSTVLVALFIAFLAVNKAKKTRSCPSVTQPVPPVVVEPDPTTWPPETAYDPYKPITYEAQAAEAAQANAQAIQSANTPPPENPPLTNLTSRELRIIELFATSVPAPEAYGQGGEVPFVGPGDLNRHVGDPATASFDSAVERGILETGRTPEGKHGYRLTAAAEAHVIK